MTGKCRWGGVGAVIAVTLVFLLQGCLPAPVGDPQKSKVNDKYTGVWRSVPAAGDTTGGSTLIMMHPWDEHTYYLVTQMVDKDWKPLPKAGQGHFKAWLTTLGGATFLTAEPMDGVAFAYGARDGGKPFWIVERVELKDGSVTVRLVNKDSWIVKDLSTTAKLEAAIKAQADNPELYVEPGAVYKKLPPEDAKKAQDAFDGSTK